MKRIISAFLILMMLISICIVASSCSSDNNATAKTHIHSYGEWTVVTSPTLKQSGVKKRVCSCGEQETAEIPSKFDELADFMTNNASDYSDGSYTVRENAKNFGKDCRLIYPGYGVDEGGWTIALTFNPSTKNTVFLVSYGYVSSMLDSLAFSVQDGVVVDRYDYLFQEENFTGGYKDQIYGSIYPSSLNASETLNYKSYSAGSGGAFKYFADSYQKYACGYAKQLVIFFNAYFKSKGLSLNMSDFGFSE